MLQLEAHNRSDLSIPFAIVADEPGTFASETAKDERSAPVVMPVEMAFRPAKGAKVRWTRKRRRFSDAAAHALQGKHMTATATIEESSLEQHQVARLQRMLREVLAHNEFYRTKLPKIDAREVDSLARLREFPFTTKKELVEDQANHPPFGSNLTYPLERYIRVHQTSGTTGKPLFCLDTEESWVKWWADCWKKVYEGAGVKAGDRIFFAFSFGPFIGFWSAWEGARAVSALAISGGGQSTIQRIKAILDYRATVVVCTPTYALHMAYEAAHAGIDLARESAVRIVINAGEPGANIPSTKNRIQQGWGAKCYDHAGLSEVGAWGFECQPQPGGIHANEMEFIPEVIDPRTGKPVGEGEKGELVLTNLGRIGNPVVRYRTGDLVEPSHRGCSCGERFVFLRGGIIGRADDMVVVRGVNVYPSAIENLVREFPEIEEFRIETYMRDELRELKLIVEPGKQCASADDLRARLGSRIQRSLNLRAIVEVVAPQTLPRFEMKAKRLVVR